MRRRTYVLWKRILTRFFILTVVFGLSYVYFRTGTFTIQSYAIEGVPDMYLPDMEREVRAIAEQRLYKILPGNRTISYRDDDIRALIMDTLPNTSSISIHPTGLHTLAIKLSSYVPLFSISDTYAISKDGTIYKEIIPIEKYPRLTIASSTRVSPDMLLAIASLAGNIDSVLFPVRFITIDDYNDIRFYDETKKTSVIIAASNNGEKTWSNIVSAIDTDPLKKKLSAKVEHLEYLDARFGNKVFYKFTNSAVPAIIPPHDENSTGDATTTLR